MPATRKCPFTGGKLPQAARRPDRDPGHHAVRRHYFFERVNDAPAHLGISIVGALDQRIDGGRIGQPPQRHRRFAAQQVIDAAIHENRLWEWVALGLTVSFAAVGIFVILLGPSETARSYRLPARSQERCSGLPCAMR